MNYQKKQKNRFKPGNSHYRDFINSLSPEEYQQHLAERRRRKAMRQAMETVQNEFQSEWISAIHNAAWKTLQRALETGDPVAFATVYDRVIGKPAQKDAADTERPLPFSDDLLG